MNKKTGGSAFPEAYLNSNQLSTEKGMTLRDYFSAKAMHGMLSGGTHSHIDTKNLAKYAYLIADEMISEREK